MGNTYDDKQNHDENDGSSFHISGKNGKITIPCAIYTPESKTWNFLKGAKPKTLVLNLAHSETGHWVKGLFLKRSSKLETRVPRHLVSLDEKYLRRCLELMHIRASKGSSCALSLNFNSTDIGLMSECVTITRRNSIEGNKYAIGYPMQNGNGDLDMSFTGEGIVGSIMESSSMMSILRSPLLQKFGISDHEANLGGSSLFQNKRCIPSPYYQGSPSHSTLSPSRKPGMKTLTFRNQELKSDSVQQSPVSMSSGLSIHSDRSSPSSYSPSHSQGMLQCTWKVGVPHFTLSLDDQKELYVANACKVDLASEKAVDYVYTFHSKPSGQKKSNFADNESDLIGKMKVSTSISLCPNNSKVLETEFVMVGQDENHALEMHSSNQNKRTRKFSKVMEVFKSGHHPLKQRTPSLFGGSSPIPGYLSTEKSLAVGNNLKQQQRRANISDIDFIPNLEIAAVVVKDHIHHEKSEEEEGGWGLKFLKKADTKKNTISSETSISSECCQWSANQCSTSIDIILPSGHHGGPETKDGRPNSLIDRWKKGGQCDCGGWDIGCPLKVFKARPRREENWSDLQSPSEFKSFDVFTEGSKKGKPTLKLVIIHEDLYLISFQSSILSPLQCLSIAVAIIHSQSPSLRPKNVHD